MRILLLPRPDRPMAEKLDGLRAAGIDAEVFDTREVGNFPPALGALLDRHRPEVVLAEYRVLCTPGPNVGGARFVRYLRKGWPGVRLWSWIEEVRDPYSRTLRDTMPFVERVLLCHDDERGWAAIRNRGFGGTFGLMWGSVDPEPWTAHPEIGKGPPEYDVAFAGNAMPGWPGSEERMAVLRAIDRRFRLAVGGEGWHGLRHPLGRVCVTWLPVLYASAKVILGHTQFQYRRYYPERDWHGLACPRAYVRRRVPGMEEDFPDALSYSTADEAVATVEATLRDWEGIGVRQAAEFRERHSWAAHYATLLPAPVAPPG